MVLLQKWSEWKVLLYYESQLTSCFMCTNQQRFFHFYFFRDGERKSIGVERYEVFHIRYSVTYLLYVVLGQLVGLHLSRLLSVCQQMHAHTHTCTHCVIACIFLCNCRTFSEINKPAELYKKCYELCEALTEDLSKQHMMVSHITVMSPTVLFSVKNCLWLRKCNPCYHHVFVVHLCIECVFACCFRGKLLH